MITSLRCSLLRLTGLACALAVASATLQAQSVAYTGVGGRHEQDLYEIQRNIPLASTGTVNIPSTTNNRRIFVRFLTGSTSENVTGFDIRMRFGLLGEVVPAWIYTADAQNRPASPVLTGRIGIGLNMHYCRASFPTGYTVQPNQLYFLAFQLPAFENVVFSTVSAASAAAVTYFVTPSGSAQQANLQYGVNTDGYSPRISLQQPFIGNHYTVSLTQAAVGLPAALWFTLIQPGLAQDLYPFGSPGSALDLGLPNILLAGVDTGAPNRQRSLTLWMPNQTSLIGQPLFFQWQVAVSGNGIPAGWVTSDMAQCVVK